MNLAEVATENIDFPDCPDAVTAVMDAASPIDTVVTPWWLVHTKPRHEKALSTDLDSRGIAHFLPLVRVSRRYGSRRAEVEIPLFPGYLFLSGGADERYDTLMTHRAANIYPIVDQEQLKLELRHIHRVVSADQPVDLYPGLRRGRRCRVIGGSLKGTEGVVLRRRDRCHVYVGVEVLGLSAELEIEPALLELLD